MKKLSSLLDNIYLLSKTKRVEPLSKPAIIVQPESCIHSLLQCGQLTLDRIKFIVEQCDDVLFQKFDLECPPQIKRAVKKRKAEFFYGRLAARYATKRFGFTGNIPINADRSPQWPDGLHDSISHCEGEAVAVALPKTDCSGVGVDIERVATGDALSALKHMVVNAEELLRLQRYQDVHSEATLLTLVFSAKESFYKAAYLHVQRVFGFEALQFESLDIHESRVTFTVIEDLSLQLKSGLQMVVDFRLYGEKLILSCLRLVVM